MPYMMYEYMYILTSLQLSIVSKLLKIIWAKLFNFSLHVSCVANEITQVKNEMNFKILNVKIK